MDFAKIKNLVRLNGDKFIFIENGEPELVMMSFPEYEKLLRGGTGHVPEMKSIRGSFEQRPETNLHANGEISGYRDDTILKHSSHLPESPLMFGVGVKNESAFTGTEFMPPRAVVKKISTIPVRPEDIRLEDLPLC